MADILSAVIGSAGTSSQANIQDPVTQQMQRERLSQILALFQGGGLFEFGGGGGEAYQPTSFSTDLANIAQRDMNAAPPLDYSNLISLEDYQRAFDPITQEYNAGLGRLQAATQGGEQANYLEYSALRDANRTGVDRALVRSYEDWGTGMGAQDRALATGTESLNTAYNAAIARGDFDLARSLQNSAANASSSLQNAETNYNRGLGINYATAGEGLRRSTANAQNALGTSEQNYLRSLGLSDANLGRELGINTAFADRAYGVNQATAGQGIGRNESNLLRSLGIAGADANRSLATQDFNRARALELGIGATGNYIDQIARPRLEQVMALQGLERGGALPAAIARATAEQAMPYLQSIENAYGSNQANTLNSLMSLRAGLTGQASAQDAAILQQLLGIQGNVGTTLQGLQATAGAGATANQALAGRQLSEQQQATLAQLTGIQGTIDEQLMALQSGLSGQNQQIQANIFNALSTQQAAAQQTAQQGNISLGGQRMSNQTQLSTNYQNNINQLAQALMANNVTLEQAGIDAQSALGQQLVQAQTALRTQQQQGITDLTTNYVSNANAFAQSLPAASTALTMAPLQMQTARTQNLLGLQGLADFPRQLQEADLLRRQGLFTTAFTGIPFAPSTSTSGTTETANLVENLFS